MVRGAPIAAITKAPSGSYSWAYSPGSWDAAFAITRRRFGETGDAGLIWQGHKASRDIGYCHMEKLANLDNLPPFGVKVYCLPVRIDLRCSGSECKIEGAGIIKQRLEKRSGGRFVLAKCGSADVKPIVDNFACIHNSGLVVL